MRTTAAQEQVLRRLFNVSTEGGWTTLETRDPVTEAALRRTRRVAKINDDGWLLFTFATTEYGHSRDLEASVRQIVRAGLARGRAGVAVGAGARGLALGRAVARRVARGGLVAGAGIKLPESFDLKGIFSLVTQVLGLTWQNIRARAVRLLGEKTVVALEKGSEIVRALVTGGVGAVWEHIKGAIGDLKAAVLDQIKSFVITKVITAGVTWILSLLNPASAFIKACKAIYDTVPAVAPRTRRTRSR